MSLFMRKNAVRLVRLHLDPHRWTRRPRESRSLEFYPHPSNPIPAIVRKAPWDLHRRVSAEAVMRPTIWTATFSSPFFFIFTRHLPVHRKMIKVSSLNVKRALFPPTTRSKWSPMDFADPRRLIRPVRTAVTGTSFGTAMDFKRAIFCFSWSNSSTTARYTSGATRSLNNETYHHSTWHSYHLLDENFKIRPQQNWKKPSFSIFQTFKKKENFSEKF